MSYPGEIKRLPKDESWRAFYFQEKPRYLWNVPATIPEYVHGTANGYSNYHCRCAPCTKAGSAANKKTRNRRMKLAKAGLYIIEHGTYNAYTNYGCRCVKCKIINRYTSAPGDRRRTFKHVGQVIGHRPLVGGPWLLFLAVLHDTMRGRRHEKTASARKAGSVPAFLATQRR